MLARQKAGNGYHNGFPRSEICMPPTPWMGTSEAERKNVCGVGNWWVVVHTSFVAIRENPSLQAKLLGVVNKNERVFAESIEGPWIKVVQKQEPTLVTSGWMLWDGAEAGFGMLLRPLAHVQAINKYHGAEIDLPHEAVNWTLAEVDVFIGSDGYIKPSRQSAAERQGKRGKRFRRAVRGGCCVLEYRVDAPDDAGNGGVFLLQKVEKYQPIEVCPLLDLDAKLSAESEVLSKNILKTPSGATALPLGYARLYATASRPNLRWAFRDKDIVIWASCELHLGDEVTLSLSHGPSDISELGPFPTDFCNPPVEANDGRTGCTGHIRHGQSHLHGLGVFAMRNYNEGDLIESCPTLELDEAGAEALISYRWGVEGTGAEDQRRFCPLGFGGLYNHQEPPHAMGKLDLKRCVLEIRAVRQVLMGEEILVTYGKDYWNDDFQGHRKVDLNAAAPIPLVLKAVDHKIQRILNLQACLLGAFCNIDFQIKLAEHREISEGKASTMMHLLVPAEAPVLKRFGYSENASGALKMSDDLSLMEFAHPEIPRLAWNNEELMRSLGLTQTAGKLTAKEFLQPEPCWLGAVKPEHGVIVAALGSESESGEVTPLEARFGPFPEGTRTFAVKQYLCNTFGAPVRDAVLFRLRNDDDAKGEALSCRFIKLEDQEMLPEERIFIFGVSDWPPVAA
eukprot:gnl/MRDRNA2_/MRDRNA2_70789_c0_seq1.p1 gnl/MRDRNA2_/MRDRNA2_70789_c0~~gnl/MRDRNA2_/MRDRNA2_70789_c0_seq1.p1  ORF type:complete len:679 (-),score=118.06 gnl/MRDRNA2_/MRDRNA2_70789_c0_seq1:209-2245(-)